MSKVLVVEDEKAVRQGLERVLAGAGWQVQAAEDLAGARKALADDGVACVLLDVRLPDGDGLQFLEEAGVSSLVEHHAEESQITLPRLLSQGRRFDLAVVDGNHRFDAVFLDLAYLGRLLRPGAIVFLDDYHLPAIARAASFFLTNRGWALEEISTAEDRHHWAVLRTSTTPDTRPFDYFVDF